MHTTILLIRHGQTDWNAEGRWQGHEDIPLNQAGRQQALLLARRLKSWPLNAIYCSDLRRTSETAAIIAGESGLRPVSDVQWRERDLGHFAGLTQEEIQQQYPEAWARFQEGEIAMPGAEGSRELQSRAATAFELLLQQHNGETIAVVSHGGTIGALIAHVLGVPFARPARFRVGGNTGLSIVTVREGRPPVLERLNDIAHLEAAGADGYPF